MARIRIAYVVNHVAFFVSHRLPLAVGARAAGYDVALFTGQAGSSLMEEMAIPELTSAGISHRRAAFRSSGMNPLVELLGLLQLTWFLVRFKPDIVHCASPKGVLYGGVAARLCGVRGVLLAVSGMGFAYTQTAGSGVLRVVIRAVYGALARFAFHHSNVRVVVQNRDDRALVLEAGLANDAQVALIPGSGVDLSLYRDCDSAAKEQLVLLPARMLRDKGVVEFVAAARSVKRVAPSWRFVLAGAAGYDNPTSIPEADLKEWTDEGVIEWLGHVEDIAPWFRRAAIVCLPSYREGMPKALLEAAAAKCAVVTTDVPGCREAIVRRETGELVPVGDSEALAAALTSLIREEERRIRYGTRGFERAKELFSIESVVDQTLGIYRELLGAP